MWAVSERNELRIKCLGFWPGAAGLIMVPFSEIKRTGRGAGWRRAMMSLALTMPVFGTF